jgi:hypothetical protein
MGFRDLKKLGNWEMWKCENVEIKGLFILFSGLFCKDAGI